MSINKIYLKSIFSISAIIISINFYFFVKERSLMQYMDWIINYQGGFVRRGFVGEFFFQFSKLTFIRLDLLIFIFVVLLYIFFFKNFYKLLKDVSLNYLNILVLFSPFSFLYPVMEQKVSGRKDILFLFLLSFMCIYLKKIKFENQKYLIILFASIIILSHTGFLFFLSFFLIIFFIENNKKPIKKLLKEICIILISIIITTIIVYLNTSIEKDGILKLCSSISQFVGPDCENSGYVSMLSWSLEYNKKIIKEIWEPEGYYFFFLKAFIFGFAPMLFTFVLSSFTKIKKLNVFLFSFIILISTLPLYYLGTDYGRYMHITYLSLLMVYFFSIKKKFIQTDFKVLNFFKNQKLQKIKFIIIFLYGFTITIPHCCSNEFKFIYAKIISKSIKFLN